MNNRTSQKNPKATFQNNRPTSRQNQNRYEERRDYGKTIDLPEFCDRDPKSVNNENIKNSHQGYGHGRRLAQPPRLTKSLDFQSDSKSYQHMRRSQGINGMCKVDPYSHQESPFSFFINENDLAISQRTNIMMNNTIQSLYFNPLLDQYLYETFHISNEILVNYATSVRVNDTNSKQYAIDEWLKTKSEQERAQYLSRYSNNIVSAES